MRRVVCFGEMLLRLAAPRGELLSTTGELKVYVGGAEANVAIALGYLGHRTAMISVLPDNVLGALALGELRRHAVDTAGVRTGAGRMGLYFLERGAGQRPARVVYDREHSAFSRALSQSVSWDTVLAECGWLHVSGITAALSAAAAHAVLAGVRAARERGMGVSFDCNYRPSLWQGRAAQAGEVMREIAGHAEVLFANEYDLALMCGQPAPTEPATAESFAAAARAALGCWAQPRLVATTFRRERGADDQMLSGVCVSREGVYQSGAYTLRDIVERIGSGDAFAAGVLHGVLSDFDPQHTAEFATAAACLKHSLAGDFSIVSVADIEALLRGETAFTR